MEWLKKEFRDVTKIDEQRGLSDKARRYLKIIHQNKNQRAEEPSRSDVLSLQNAYGKIYVF